MTLSELLNKKRVCKHTKVLAEADLMYCPDCGELVENQWYLTRCACCSIKLKSIIKHGETVPVEKFCHNCGSQNFVCEKLAKINFVDINFAVLVKKVVPSCMRNFVQSWVEPCMRGNPKLIGLK